MKFHWEHVVGLLGLLGIVLGELYGLTPCTSGAPWAKVGLCSPPDAMMGDTVRIMYVHVPSAWNAMLVLTVAWFAAIATLVLGLFHEVAPRLRSIATNLDHLSESAAEVGTLLCGLVLVQGALWAKPTWGVYWAPWEPRLTLTAVLFFAFAGVVVLRSLPLDSRVRGMIASVVTVFVGFLTPCTYFVVRVMPSIHQMQSSPTDVDSPLRWGWRMNAIAVALLATWFIARRWRIAKARHLADAPPPLPETTSR